MNTPDIWIALDVETSSTNRYACEIDRVCTHKFNVRTGERLTELDCCFRGTKGAGYISMLLNELKRQMASGLPVVMHNACYDLYLLESRLGIPVRAPVHDTFLMTKHWRNDLPSYSLKSLAWHFFGDVYTPLLRLREWIHKQRLKGEDDMEFDMTLPPDKLVHDYCIHDVQVTARLACRLLPLVEDNFAYQQDTEMIRANMETESAGIEIDVPGLKHFVSLGGRRMKRNRKQAQSLLDTKNSPRGKALEEHLAAKGETRTTPTGKTKKDDSVLRDHKDSPAVRAVSREINDSTDNNFAKKILQVCGSTTHFHPSLNLSEAITRRHRSRNIYGDNGLVLKGQVQNVTRGEGLRNYFISPKGFWTVKLDLASIEARKGAHLMATVGIDSWFAEQYRLDDEFNIYLFVVKECTGHGTVTKKDNVYQAFKHGVLGIQYGVGVDTYHKTLVDKFNLPYTHSECENIYATIRRNFPQFKGLQRTVSNLIEKQGYILDDYGAIYYVPQQERYKGVNYYCQGCAGNTLKMWWLKVRDRLSKGDYIWLVVHDELDLAVAKAEGKRTALKRVKSYCDAAREIDLFSLPIIAEPSGLKENWGDCG